MTDEELKELVASLAIKSDRLDAQLSRTDEQIVELLSAQKESARKLDKVGDLLGNIARNQGDVAEEFFFNSLASDTHLGSVHFDDITKNQHKQRGKFQEEYDIVMTNGEAVGIVEVKYKVHENDLKKLERKMRNFKKLFPIYEAYKLYGAIASFHINDDAKEAALNQGFFVLQRKGDVLQTDCAKNLMVL
ncbi:MAG: hypothetical protein WCL34_13705 [Methylococcaceae bacterium]